MSRLKQLDPFAYRYAGLVADIEEHVAGLSASRLRSLEKSLDALTSTNCWWSTYQLAPIVCAAIYQERYQRKHRSRKAQRPEGDSGSPQ